MAFNSHYGSSARKQLVRPFLSSPVAVFAYLLLILSAVGLLEWVLRVSATAQFRRDRETRAAWFDEYYSKAALLPKHTVSNLRPVPRVIGLLRRQSGDLDPPPSTTSDYPSFFTTTPTSSSPTTTSSEATTSTPAPFTIPTSSSLTTTPSQTTTSASVLRTTTTTSSPLTITTTTSLLQTTAIVTTSFRTTTSTSVPSITTTAPLILSSATSSLSSKETTTTATATISLSIPITTTITTTTRNSTPPQPATTAMNTAITDTSVVISSISPTILTPSTLSSTTLSSSEFVTTTTIPNENVLSSDVLELLSSTNRGSSFSSVTPISSQLSSPSSKSATSSLSTTIAQNIVDSSSTTTSEQMISSTSLYESATILLITTSSSAGLASLQQEVTKSTSTKTPTTTESSFSVESIANMASTTVSKSIITASVLPTKISSVQESIATSTALAVSTCHHGFVCLFANRDLTIPLKDGYKTLPVPIDVIGEFGATYASIIIVLLFQSFWLIIYASIRLNEPFHQLAQPQYATLEVGLLFEFLVIGFPMDHFKSGFRGNWSSWYIITAYMVLLMTMVAPSLAAEAFSVQNLKVYCGKGSANKDCVQRVWTIAPGPVRALQVLLIMVALLVFVVLMVRSYRGSALSLKKVSLALIATTLSDPHTAGFLCNINPDTPLKEAVPFLQTRSWALEPSTTTEIGTEHGSYILRSSPERNSVAQEVHSKYAERSSRRHGPPGSLMNLLIPAFLIIFLIILVVIYTVNGIDDSKLTVFFGSVSFGPKFLLVSMSTILGIALSRAENEVRVLTPYRSLYGASNPQPLLTRRLHPSPLTQAFAAFKHGEWVSAFVSFMTGYGVNILAMTISNIPYHPGRSVSGTVTCIFVTLGLLVLMAVALVVVAIWRRGNSNLEIQGWPTTLADVYILMAHSRIPGVQGIHGSERGNQDVLEFYGEAYDKKAMVVQRIVEVEEQ